MFGLETNPIFSASCVPRPAPRAQLEERLRLSSAHSLSCWNPTTRNLVVVSQDGGREGGKYIREAQEKRAFQTSTTTRSKPIREPPDPARRTLLPLLDHNSRPERRLPPSPPPQLRTPHLSPGHSMPTPRLRPPNILASRCTLLPEERQCGTDTSFLFQLTKRESLFDSGSDTMTTLRSRGRGESRGRATDRARFDLAAWRPRGRPGGRGR